MPDDYRAPACGQHATQDERIEYAHLMAIAEDRRRSVMDCSPACWSWDPPTAADRERLRQQYARVCKMMGEERFEELLPTIVLDDWQQGRCAVCGLKGVSMVEDHDHETGLFRGILCRRCNVAEGMNGDNLRVWREYRQRNPAVILGIVEPYYNPYTREYAGPAPV